ncbi:MAG TPA: patatin-like phospholipase family protein [Macromonas sp.]|nr:patatin-like phospholipase family protein [Macromonas sp.]
MPTQRTHGRLTGWLLTVLLWLGQPALASETTGAAAPTAQAHRPKVALVLSGGGARGFAHVGILKALEAAHVPVDMVVGTSMGAIIGGLYATGMSAEELEREIQRQDWPGMFLSRPPRPSLPHRQKEEDFEFSPVLQVGFRDGEFRLPQGAVSSNALELLLRRYTLHTRHLENFDGLPTPFRAVATDMETGEAVILSSGDLAAALRASMSVPGVFAPLEWNDRILGDGGLVDNLPVDVARAMGADAIIAINIGTPLSGRDKLGSVVGVSLQMINILTQQNVQRNLQQLTRDDLLLEPPLGKLTSADFSKALELMTLGQTYADTVTASLERYALPPAEYAQWQAERRQTRLALQDKTSQPLAFVRLHGVSLNQIDNLLTRVEAKAGQTLNSKVVEQDVARLASTEAFQRIDYRLEDTARGEGLVYELQESDVGPHQFRIGLGLKSDFQGQGDFNLRLSHNLRQLTDNGAEWRNRLELGATVALGSELYQLYGTGHTRFFSLYADHELRKVEVYDPDGSPLVSGRRRTSHLGLDHGWHLGEGGSWGDFRLGWIGTRRQSIPDFINSSVVVPSEITWTESALRLAVVTDQLDHANFPQSGHRFTLDVQSGTLRDDLGKTSFLRWDGSLNAVTTVGTHTFNAYVRLARTDHIPPGAIDEYSLGGFQQLSGYRVGQVVGSNLALGRLSYYHRLTAEPGLARAWFAGGSLELGNAWNSTQDMSWNDLRAGSSLFIGADTGFGPLYLSLVHAPRGYTGIYFLLGRP